MLRNKVEDLSVSLANNISSKQESDVHCDRIQEDEIDSYTQRERETFSSKRHYFTFTTKLLLQEQLAT